jgi:hypothetical protein
MSDTDANYKTTDIKTIEDIEIDVDIGEGPRGPLEKKLLRKIDTRLMPLLMLIYVLNYLDRNNISDWSARNTTPS